MGNSCTSKPNDKKVLMVFTNHDKLGDTGKPTGWYLAEAAHPYKVFTDAGFDITFASPKGGVAPLDPGSVDAAKDDADCIKFHEDKAVKLKLEKTVALSTVAGHDFAAVFFVGGFGTMWDFPDDANVQRVTKEVHESGGVVSAVCHGPIALVNVKLSDGSLLVKDKEVTAFTNGEEDAVSLRAVVPYTCEDKFKEAGAKYSDGGVFQSNVVVDGRLITGQNPPSAGGCAKAVVASLSRKKVVMVFTNHSKLGDTDEQTGWYLPEAAHPYKVFHEAGFEISFASPKGGLAPVDLGSVDASKEDAICMKFHENAELKKMLESTEPLSKVKGSDVHAVFYVGGFGVMWDFPDDENVQRVAKEVHESGGVVSAVCHGPVALVNVKLSDGSLLVKDREVTAFSNGEEDYVSRRAVVPYTCEDKFKEVGAKYNDGGVFQSNVVVDGRLITGQNPPSAEACGRAVMKALIVA